MKQILSNPTSNKDEIAQQLVEMGMKKEKITQKDCVALGLVNRAKYFGDVKAFEKIQELTNEQTNALLELRKQELELKRQELELKRMELELKKNQGIDDDKVVIVNDIEDINEGN